MIHRWLFVLSLAGLLISSFLAYEYSIGSVVCPAGAGCDIVRTSEYSRLFGVSIPYFGIAYYLAASTLSIILSYTKNNLIWRLFFLISLVSFIFGLRLTYLEGFVINAYCIWCVMSFIISGVILVIVGTQAKFRQL